MKYLALILISSLTVISCGNSKNKKTSPQFQVDESSGVFITTLNPLNTNVASFINGTARLSHFGDDFRVKIILKDAPKVTHRQYLMAGYSCPTVERDDANRDGILDVEEAIVRSGKILLPLDADLASRLGTLAFESTASAPATATCW